MIFTAAEAIAMERRHIREGEARIVQQEGLVARIDQQANSEAQRQARELLAEHRRFVEVAKERLADLQQRYPPIEP